MTRGPEVTIVVTAAHCASLNRSGLSLICGGHNLAIDPETGAQTFPDGYQLNIISIKTHEEYDDRKYINDIALIFAEVSLMVQLTNKPVTFFRSQLTTVKT